MMIRTIEVIVTIPPEVVRMRASSTVLVKASSRWNRDLTGMIGSGAHVHRWRGYVVIGSTMEGSVISSYVCSMWEARGSCAFTFGEATSQDEG
jgi:hypothetical protein